MTIIMYGCQQGSIAAAHSLYKAVFQLQESVSGSISHSSSASCLWDFYVLWDFSWGCMLWDFFMVMMFYDVQMWNSQTNSLSCHSKAM